MDSPSIARLLLTKRHNVSVHFVAPFRVFEVADTTKQADRHANQPTVRVFADETRPVHFAEADNVFSPSIPYDYLGPGSDGTNLVSLFLLLFHPFLFLFFPILLDVAENLFEGCDPVGLVRGKGFEYSLYRKLTAQSGA
jgi:hypothetical protein